VISTSVWSYCGGRGFGIKGLASGLGFGVTYAIFSTCFPPAEAVIPDDDGADVDGCGVEEDDDEDDGSFFFVRFRDDDSGSPERFSDIYK